MKKDSLSELEKEFKDLVDEKQVLIFAKLEQASQLLSEAVSISEEFGIPFNANISAIRQSYFPVSFDKKFGKLDQEFAFETADAYSEYPQYGGWQHSAVC
jgi:hypothetical protein